jgi:hypothetical protein
VGVAWSAQLIPTAVNFVFLDRSRYFPFKQLLNYPYEAEWTLFQTHYFSENLVAPGIEPGTSEFVDYRGGLVKQSLNLVFEFITVDVMTKDMPLLLRLEELPRLTFHEGSKILPA